MVALEIRRKVEEIILWWGVLKWVLESAFGIFRYCCWEVLLTGHLLSETLMFSGLRQRLIIGPLCRLMITRYTFNITYFLLVVPMWKSLVCAQAGSSYMTPGTSQITDSEPLSNLPRHNNKASTRRIKHQKRASRMQMRSRLEWDSLEIEPPIWVRIMICYCGISNIPPRPNMRRTYRSPRAKSLKWCHTDKGWLLQKTQERTTYLLTL